MTSLLPNAEQQFVDGSGAPYALGKVYFYEPETLFFKDTWQDAAQQTLNTNPVNLDAAGRAIIYGSGAYRQILKDVDDNIVWDQETADLTTASVTGGPESVISATTATPPGSPSVGNAYIVPAGATGAWTGHATDVATWTNAGAWSFVSPTQGWQTYVDDTGDYAIFNGTSWETMMSFTDWSTATRIVDNFSGQPQPTPNMTVLVDPGAILNGTTLTQVGARLSANLTQGLTSVLGLESVTGLISGLAVRGPGIATGTTITVSGSTVTLSIGATETKTQAALVFAQVTGTITAPVANPRIDRVVVDQTTGIASVITGTPAANPTPPAISAGKYPVCQVRLETSTTSITRGMLLDERAWIYANSSAFPGSESTVASATTTDIGAAASFLVSISGTTTITSLGSSASTSTPLYYVRFTGALTLTYNGTTLIIPGAANILTAAGDTAVLQYLGSGNWRVREYQRANGQTISMSGATVSVASATTTDIGATGSNSVLITGTTTITSLGATATIANPIYFLRFNGVLQLTYNGTSLILPGATSITTAAGDCAIAEYVGSGNWRLRDYEPATGVTTVNSPTIILTGSASGSSSTTLDLASYVSAYKSFEIRLTRISISSAGANVTALVHTAAGDLTASYGWALSIVGSTGVTATLSNNSDASARIMSAVLASGTVDGQRSTLNISSNASRLTTFCDVKSAYFSGASISTSASGSFHVSDSSDAFTGVTIKPSAGTISFTYTVIGYT